MLSSSTCNAWFGDHYLPIIQKTRLIKLRAKQTILTTGSSEQHVVFRNNDLPGVVMCSALDRLMRLYGVVLRRRCCISRQRSRLPNRIQ